MKAAPGPRGGDEVRMVIADAASGATRIEPAGALARLLGPADLVVVNDAATLPASLRARMVDGARIEVRLAAERADGRWLAVLFDDGDWRTDTERRPPPPALGRGNRLAFEGGLTARVHGVDALSPRLVELAFDTTGPGLWSALLRSGRPVQYSYLARDLALRDVQTRYGGRPWAVEPPSAGFPLTGERLVALVRRGVRLAAVTHGAGLSSTGDALLDARLPLPERFEVGGAAVQAIRETHERGGRVVAVGTTVVRALAAAESGGELRPAAGITGVRVGPGRRPASVDAVLSGLHDASESHYALLAAFAPPRLLGAALAEAERAGCVRHEFGDVLLVLARERVAAAA
jgi:S-adenosylmethionine:tRNA ribosyltransferase-isomerase